MLTNKKFIQIGKRKKFQYIFFNKKYLQYIFFNNSKFIITGGSSINYFLKKILNKKNNYLINKNKINKYFYLSDERICSSIKFSNSYKIKKLFKKLPKSYRFYAINNFPSNITSEVKRYNNILPKKIDAAFLSIGNDYHIASLFKNTKIHCKNRYIFLTACSNFKFKRISMNKYFLSKPHIIYIFINGIKKFRQFNFMVRNKILNKYINFKDQNKIILILKGIKKIHV